MDAVSTSTVPPVAASRQREFAFTEDDFRTLSALAARHAGIHMSEAKRELVYGRLARRLRQLGMKRFEDYCALLAAGDEQEIETFTNAITTNLTSFFREPHHFEYLRQELVPEWLAGPGRSPERKLRVWCAGCSTGEEPYSVAMAILEACTVASNESWSSRLLSGLRARARLTPRTASGPQAAISLAIPWAVSRTSPAGTQRFARPMAAASGPRTVRLM